MSYNIYFIRDDKKEIHKSGFASGSLEDMQVLLTKITKYSFRRNLIVKDDCFSSAFDSYRRAWEQ